MSTYTSRTPSSTSTLNHPERTHEPKPDLEDAPRSPTREHATSPIDADPLELPYRTLTENADMAEYTTETATGTITRKVTSNKTGKTEDYELVTFTPGDRENPKNWSKAYKWWCTMVVAVTCFAVAFNSAVITADMIGPQETFGISEEVALLTITVFVVGFGVGPMAFAPFSETWGRRPVYASTLLIALIFIIPCAVAKNIGTLIVCRLIDGIAFSAPMVLVGGTLADLWKAEERGVPMAAFSAAPFVGPAIGPLVGGFTSDHLGWRWLYWLQLILSGFVYILIVFTVPETYAPIILAKRAKKMRKDTGDSRYVSESDLDTRPIGERMKVFILRPFQLLFCELIVFLISLYMSVLYGLLYMFFVAFPIIYQEGKGYSASTTGLMFIPLAIGVIASAFLAPLINMDYARRSAKFGVVGGYVLRADPLAALAAGDTSRNGWGYLAMVCVYVNAFIICATWQGITWTYASEIFPLDIRMLCVALTTADTWLGSFIIARSTPYMISDLGYGAYFFFGVILVAMGIWSFFFVPETRGITLEEMDALFFTNESLGTAKQSVS
ncbi:MFS general substrate transporter, partial [Aureobasidium pullulans]